jgi:oxygen-dependent protoporphyrinogen oxidase
MQQLVDTLARQLDGVDLLTGTSVVEIKRMQTGQPEYLVRTDDGSSLPADALLLTTPSDVSARLVETMDPKLAADLGEIRYVTTAVVSLGFKPDAASPDLDGFGFIIPKTEKRRITASTWTSTKFNHRVPDGYRLMRCFIGGPGREAYAEQDDQSLTTMVRQELAEIMDLQAEPDLVQIDRWNKANPQYDLNHLDRVAELRSRAEANGSLYLAGSSYDGVGVPDCIRQGQEAAAKILSKLHLKEA